MITEDEAKTKWCPMSRLLTGAEGMAAGNRPVDGHPALMCIGSACMMWRFHEPAHDQFWVSLDGKPEELWHWDPTGSDNYVRRVKVRKATEGRKGYCGLAGKPE